MPDDGDDDDDGFDDVFTLAHFPGFLAVVTKTGCNNKKRMPMGENKQVRNRAHGSIVPARKRKGTIELWFTIPYHMQPSNARNTSMVIHVHSFKRKEKEEKQEQGTERRKKGKNKSKKNEANLRSQGAGRAPRISFVVCWYKSIL